MISMHRRLLAGDSMILPCLQQQKPPLNVQTSNSFGGYCGPTSVQSIMLRQYHFTAAVSMSDVALVFMASLIFMLKLHIHLYNLWQSLLLVGIRFKSNFSASCAMHLYVTLYSFMLKSNQQLYEPLDYYKTPLSIYCRRLFGCQRIRRKWLARWIVSFLIGIGTAIVASIIEVCIEFIAHYKFIGIRKRIL